MKEKELLSALVQEIQVTGKFMYNLIRSFLYFRIIRQGDRDLSEPDF